MPDETAARQVPNEAVALAHARVVEMDKRVAQASSVVAHRAMVAVALVARRVAAVRLTRVRPVEVLAESK